MSYRSSTAVLALAAALVGCHVASREEIARDPKYGWQMQGCAAAEVAIIEDTQAPKHSGFGRCDITTSDGRHFTVATTIRTAFTDKQGKEWPGAFYYADTELDPKTGAMRATSLARLERRK